MNPNPGAVTTSDMLFLEAAIELAEAGRMSCAPNPTVGCIITRSGDIIGRGFHRRAGEAHAEVEAIADAGGDVAGATVYVSLEPCSFEGRTPACAQTLIDHAVSRVVVGTVDPNPRVAGAGVNMLQQAGVRVDVVDLPSAARSIAGFAKRMGTGLPWVRLKSAASLDGALALASGESKWLTGTLARQDVQYWRARSDAILTGVGTLIEDDPQLNVRAPELLAQGVKQPLRVLLDSRLRAPADRKMLGDGAPTLVVHDAEVAAPEGGPPDDSLQYLALADGTRDLRSILAHLGGLGCNEVLVEGGSSLLGSFVEQGLWDEWVHYLAPKLLGSDSLNMVQLNVPLLSSAPNVQIADACPLGPDLRLTLVREEDNV